MFHHVINIQILVRYFAFFFILSAKSIVHFIRTAQLNSDEPYFKDSIATQALGQDRSKGCCTTLLLGE